MNFTINCTHCHHAETTNIVACSLCSKGLETMIKNQVKIHNTEKSIFLRYSCFFPTTNKAILNKYPNSPTPIIELNKKKIYAKLEYCSFSSSSKDREAFIEIAMAKELGYKGIAVASTGNMGGALASLCAMFKFPCYVFIPADTSEVKVKQIEQLGAIVEKVSGTYDDIVPNVIQFAYDKNLFLASLQAFRFEGYKTIAYEIYETFGKNIPKNVIIPLGDGTTYTGVWKGFKDLISAGLIDKSPALIGVQAKQCAPIATAYANKKEIKIIKNPKTLAKAIRIGNPLDGEYAIQIARKTNGMIVSYEEGQIIDAQKQLLKEGINAEYTSAITYCPVLHNNIDNCLLLMTGSGLKN